MSSVKFTLSKIDISGPLDNDTPLVVLQEIIEAHDIIADGPTLPPISFITNMALSRSFTFYHPLRDEDIITVSNFINKKVQWDLESLQIAINHVIRFYRYPFLDEIFVYGSAYSSEPETYSACMLYRLLKTNDILVCRSTTLKQMANAAMLVFETENQRNLIFRDIIQK